jgi:hypothetical protein
MASRARRKMRLNRGEIKASPAMLLPGSDLTILGKSKFGSKLIEIANFDQRRQLVE